MAAKGPRGPEMTELGSLPRKITDKETAKAEIYELHDPRGAFHVLRLNQESKICNISVRCMWGPTTLLIYDISLLNGFSTAVSYVLDACNLSITNQSRLTPLLAKFAGYRFERIKYEIRNIVEDFRDIIGPDKRAESLHPPPNARSTASAA